MTPKQIQIMALRRKEYIVGTVQHCPFHENARMIVDFIEKFKGKAVSTKLIHKFLGYSSTLNTTLILNRMENENYIMQIQRNKLVNLADLQSLGRMPNYWIALPEGVDA